MHRYTALNYNDCWTSLLDRLLWVNPESRLKSLEWGSEGFTNPINKCNNRLLKPIIKSMQLLHEKIQTPRNQGTTDSFSNQSSETKTKKMKWKGKLRCFLQNDFGYNREVTLSVNNYFEGATFINYECFLGAKREISTSIDQ